MTNAVKGEINMVAEVMAKAVAKVTTAQMMDQPLIMTSLDNQKALVPEKAAPAAIAIATKMTGLVTSDTLVLAKAI